MAERSKEQVCGRSLAGIADSNPAEGMNVCVLCVLCVVQIEVSATGRSLVQRSPNEYVSLSVIRCNNKLLHPQLAGRRSQIVAVG